MEYNQRLAVAAQGGGVRWAVRAEGHEPVEAAFRTALGLPPARSNSWGKIGW